MKKSFKTQKGVEAQNKDLVKKYYTDLDKTENRELDKFIEKYISRNFVLHLPGGLEIKGKEGLKEYYASSKEAFSDGTHTVNAIIVESNMVAFRATAKAKHLGTFMGIQPSGQEFTTTFAGFWKLDNGKIIEWWSEYDALGMMMQLGMELKMKE